MKLSFRIVRYPGKFGRPDCYIGFAWDFDAPVHFSTYTTVSYEGSRNELANIVGPSYKLARFDGEYTHDYATGQDLPIAGWPGDPALTLAGA